MTFRELFEGIIKNKIPSLDMTDTIEELADKKGGVTKEFLDQMLSDFSIYLQEYVDLILKERESDTELIEEYQELKETDEVGVNFYLIQEYYDDAGLKVWQRDSILRFWANTYYSIEHAEYLMSDKVTMNDSIGNSYREGIPNSFFYEVYSSNITDLEMYSRVKELTDNFDPNKINLLCKDFDFYFWMEREWWLGSFSHEEVQDKINELEREGKEVPTLGKGDQGGHEVSDYFKTKRILPRKKLTDEQKKKRDKFIQGRKRNIDKILDKGKLMDPHGFEFYSLYRLRSLLVQIKAEHTSAELKPEFQSKFDRSTPKQESIYSNIQPIHWLNGDESLRQFLDNIKSAGLMENSETDDIIQEHFRQSDQTPQLIQWCKSNRLLIYLFNKLTEAGLVDTMNRQFQLITEHFLDRHGQQFKRDSLKQDFQNMKYSSDPRGAKTIDKIIQELTD